MARMTVIRDKPVRYPSGPDAKEYKRGEEFDTLSDRDTKALALIRAAKVVDAPAAAPESARPRRPQPMQRKAQEEQPGPKPAEPPNLLSTETAPELTPGHYRRRDMRADGSSND